MPEEWKGSVIVPIYKRVIKQILVVTRHITFVSCVQNVSDILLSILTPSEDEIIGDHDFDATGQLLIIFSIRQTLERKRECSETVHQLLTDFMKAYCSVKREVLCNMLIESGVSMKLIRLIKMCINGTYSRVQ